MKKFMLFFLFCNYSVFAWAQNEKDSLIALLTIEKRDTSRILLLSELAYTVFDKPDSMALLAEQIIQIAEKEKFKKGEIMGLNLRGMYHAFTQNNARSLEAHLEALTLAQEMEDEDLVATTNMYIGNIYNWAKEYSISTAYFRKVERYAHEINNKLLLASMQYNIGGNFEKLNILDSARHYVQQANELSIKLNVSPLRMGILLSLGEIHSKMGMDKLALEYYRLSYNEAHANNSLDWISMITAAIARLYERKGLRDSSFYYAKLSVTSHALLNRSPAIESLSLLVDYYKGHGKIDSAFFYNQQLSVLKDSLFGAEKTKQFQLLSFQESLREKRREEESVQRETERVNNLQVMGIGTFIIMFFLMMLLLSKRRTKPRIIEVFGIVLLLLVFEFISLLLHPFLERITHHTPVLIFLSLVAIAAILVPLHHRLEKLIKEKLAHKKVVTINNQDYPEHL